MAKSEVRNELRRRRAVRIRKRISGSAQRPRLCVRRSLNQIYAQLVDDLSRTTLVQVGSLSKSVSERISKDAAADKTAVSKIVGEVLAEQALSKGVTRVVFDRKGYAYHGRVKALADGARGKGLQF